MLGAECLGQPKPHDAPETTAVNFDVPRQESVSSSKLECTVALLSIRLAELEFERAPQIVHAFAEDVQCSVVTHGSAMYLSVQGKVICAKCANSLQSIACKHVMFSLDQRPLSYIHITLNVDDRMSVDLCTGRLFQHVSRLWPSDVSFTAKRDKPGTEMRVQQSGDVGRLSPVSDPTMPSQAQVLEPVLKLLFLVNYVATSLQVHPTDPRRAYLSLPT